MTTVLTAVCPECQAIYRIDPSRVPPHGLRARCTACGAVIAIGLRMPSVPAAAAPVDPAVLAASDAAAAPEHGTTAAVGATAPGGAVPAAMSPADGSRGFNGSDVWDWGGEERSTGAATAQPRASDDPWAGLWGDGDSAARPSAPPRESRPGHADPVHTTGGAGPLPPAIARRPRP